MPLPARRGTKLSARALARNGLCLPAPPRCKARGRHGAQHPHHRPAPHAPRNGAQAQSAHGERGRQRGFQKQPLPSEPQRRNDALRPALQPRTAHLHGRCLPGNDLRQCLARLRRPPRALAYSGRNGAGSERAYRHAQHRALRPPERLVAASRHQAFQPRLFQFSRTDVAASLIFDQRNGTDALRRLSRRPPGALYRLHRPVSLPPPRISRLASLQRLGTASAGRMGVPQALAVAGALPFQGTAIRHLGLQALHGICAEAPRPPASRLHRQ